MIKKHVRNFLCIALAAALAASMSGCSLSSLTAEELKVLYPQAIENAVNESLYYWKETVNASDHTSWRTCNVYAEIDKKYEPILDDNGEFANMKIDVFEEYNKKSVYKALCGASHSSREAEDKAFLFENDYDDSGEAVHYRKTEMTPQHYIASEEFINNYALSTLLSEFRYLTVEDMVFDIDEPLMEHRGKVVKFSFAVKPDYLERYKTEFKKSSVFENSTYATIELAYDRFASIIVYSAEKLGDNITVDKEVYKLETVYFGPIVEIPSYDSDVWANA